MKEIIGKKVLINTEQWFVAPDGESYKAVHGTLHGVHTDSETLGVRTNAKSTNWYVSIGDMIIAGCQINYLILCDTIAERPATAETWHEGKRVKDQNHLTYIYVTS